jgi:hypothetical protein
MSEPHEPELTDEEKIEIRSIIEKDKRWKWLATTMRNVAAWIVAVIAGLTLGYDWLVKAISKLGA